MTSATEKTKILIVGGGSELQPRLRRARAGVETAVLCRASTLPWVQAIDENHAVVVLHDDATDTHWIEAAKALRQLWHFDKIVSFAEIDQDRAGKIAHSLRLPFHGPATIACAHDKFFMRDRLRHAAVEDVPHALIHNEADLYRFVEQIGAPVIVKPQRGRSSAGIAVVRSTEDVPRALSTAATAHAPRLAPSPVLAERFIDGPEYSVEALTQDGKHFIIAITGKRSDPVSKVEMGHIVPAPIDEPTEQAILAHTRAALTAIGVEAGITHTEVIFSSNGPLVVETHLRLAGDEIPLLVRDATGIDMIELLLRQITGEDIAKSPELRDRIERPRYDGAAGIRYVAPLEDGVLERVDGWDVVAGLEGVVSVESEVPVGTRMVGLQNSYSRLGHVRARGLDGSAVERILDTATAILAVSTSCAEPPEREPDHDDARPGCGRQLSLGEARTKRGTR